MLCEKYKEALVEAAASGAALPNALREHVQACEHCAAILTGERALFAAVDAGLRKAANAEVRSSFLPNVKANLAAETVPERNPIPAWALVCATGALALAAAFLSMPRGAHDKANTEAITVQSKVPAVADEIGLSRAPEHKIRFSARAIKAEEQQVVAGAASHEPEVLVQPEEDEYLRRFYATERNPRGDVRVIVADEHETMPKPQVIAQIEVKDLRIEDLDDESGLTKIGTK
jgi:hypothetical protein